MTAGPGHADAARTCRPQQAGRVELEVYQKDPVSGAFLVEIALETYEEVFNEWDPAPYKRRDIAPDLRAYLEDCAKDIPLRHALKLVFSLPAGRQDPAKEEHVRAGLRNYFGLEIKTIRRRVRRLHRQMLAYLLLAVILLVLTSLAGRVRASSIGFEILREGLTIGAWVFAWESLSVFAFSRRRVIREVKRWTRYLQAPIEFPSQPLSSQPEESSAASR